MIPGPEFEPLTLPSGERLEVQGGDGPAGDGSLQVVRVVGGREVERLTLGHADGAGGGFVAAPDGGLVLLGSCSGQSEERFVLLRVGVRLEQVFESPLMLGEAASYSFSADGTQLVMALPHSCVEWWQPWDDGDVERLADGRACFDFGEVLVLDTATLAFRRHVLRVVPAPSWSPSAADYDPDLAPVLDGRGRLTLAMPWGPLVLPLPAPQVVLIELPASA